jgi:hypothetical protein
LGQAAPVLDDISSLATREPSPDDFPLVTRGLLSKHKADPATQKLIDHVSEVAHCKYLMILMHSEEGYLAAKQELTTEKGKLTAKSSDPLVKEYKKEIKKFASRSKKLASKIKGTKSALKKLGITDAATHCKSIAGTSPTQLHAVADADHEHQHPLSTSSAPAPASTDADTY